MIVFVIRNSCSHNRVCDEEAAAMGFVARESLKFQRDHMEQQID
jgi:hypothetical protein